MLIKPPKKTATGFSTAADVLESLQAEHPIIKLIMQYRGLEKLRHEARVMLEAVVKPVIFGLKSNRNNSHLAFGRAVTAFHHEEYTRK